MAGKTLEQRAKKLLREILITKRDNINQLTLDVDKKIQYLADQKYILKVGGTAEDPYYITSLEGEKWALDK